MPAGSKSKKDKIHERKIIIGAGVSFREAEILFDTYLREVWQKQKKHFLTYEMENFRANLGVRYLIGHKLFEVYPTHTTIVISALEPEKNVHKIKEK